MLECTICGLLSLNAQSCPACGSQNLIDLASEDEDPTMPTEVPGLDDAVSSLYELEGIEQIEDTDEIEVPEVSKSSSNSSLPFGYSGQSNVHLSRLPFGIGSHAEGVPFDSEEETEDVSSNITDSISSSQRVQQSKVTSSTKTRVEPPKQMTMVRVEPIVEANIEHESQNTMLQEVEEEVTPSFSIPDEWRISATEPNLEEIYSSPETVVEVVHQTEDDVLVYNHQDIEQSTTVNSEPSFSQNTSSLSLELHPAKALNVDVGRDTDLGPELEKGYFAIANNSWAEAAISFQKMASRMPGDSAVFNNYGLSLLQRAIEMAKDGEESIQMMASSQFESAILALREAAKSDPDESIILLNLSHALLVSGRAEKALKIVQVHNSRNPASLEGVNLEAAALVSIGQSVNAKNLLSSHKGDSIIDENLSRLL
ncbi:MAG: tetratricopeptide repeat protein [Candidatus Poseidoniaceae archaeon]